VPIPSDDAADVVAAGDGDVTFAVVSMSARAEDGQDAAYLEWHVLDHLPEQHRLDGLRWGQRWVSTPGCRAARAIAEPPFDEVDHVVHYLMAPPRPAATVDPLLDAFFALGGALHAAGRMPVSLPRRHLAGWDVVGRGASPRVLVGASVLPFRPLRGAYLLVEHWPLATSDASAGPVAPDELLRVDGVAGYWHLRGTADRHRRLQDAADLDLWIVHLDGDPVEVAGRITPVLGDRWAGHDVSPQLAAPFHVVVPWAWDRALPSHDPEDPT
jgi:hypothetical protein